MDTSFDGPLGDPGDELCWQFTRCESPPLLCRELLFKFLIVGEFGVGRFSPTYKITIGADFSLKQLRWNRTTKINLQLWDIAGHERYGYMTRVYYKYAVAAAVVFDVSRMETFQLAHKWIQDIREKVTMPDGSPIPIVLLANKSDLTEGIIQTDVISRYCREYAIGAWFITSAKDNVNIDEAMGYLVEQVLEMKAVEATKDSIVLQDPALDPKSLNKFMLSEKSSCGCG
ncbi:ras-related protein Rab-32-like isoform X2 [Neocloeon triangulifer]|uniref:ras-related protein Rab-32-like isoform X2 n=1 Tax=Neocloeon triangulifer TaxID=2078957 RepID=UPI00286F40B7|nr:ras-related protein Rab-32-like isoform X2 [Neocloeon triangulifer]